MQDFFSSFAYSGEPYVVSNPSSIGASSFDANAPVGGGYRGMRGNKARMGRGRSMEIPQELKTVYFQRRKRDLEDCRLSFKQNRFQEIEKLGHKLKGSAATFGHPQLSELGRLIELAAQTGDRKKLAHYIEELSAWLNQCAS